MEMESDFAFFQGSFFDGVLAWFLNLLNEITFFLSFVFGGVEKKKAAHGEGRLK